MVSYTYPMRVLCLGVQAALVFLVRYFVEDFSQKPMSHQYCSTHLSYLDEQLQYSTAVQQHALAPSTVVVHTCASIKFTHCSLFAQG